MKESKKIGIWMDYSHAKLITHLGESEQVQTIISGYDRTPREDGKGPDGTSWGAHSSNNEHTKNNKEQGQIKTYYSQLEEILAEYDHVLLFGPTKAKSELKNILVENKKFSHKKIDVENSDDMTDNQLKAFVRNYFFKLKV